MTGEQGDGVDCDAAAAILARVGDGDTAGSSRGQSPAWGGSVLLSLSHALYVGPVRDTAVHAHHAVQVCLAFDEPFGMRQGPSEPWQELHAAVVASDVPHQLDGRSARHAIVYLEPETRDGRRLAPAGEPGIRPLRSPATDRARAALAHSVPAAPSARSLSGLDTVIAECLALTAPTDRAIDARIARALQSVRTAPERYVQVTDLAAVVGLSAGRFRHLFASEVGTPWRRFQVWLKLYAAVRALASGSSLTDAAHEAGFADSAHFSRSFRRMFGIVPSAVSSDVRLLVDSPFPRSSTR